MNDDLLGYALNALPPAEQAAVAAHLDAQPDDRARLEKLRKLLRPLEADRAEPLLPPPGLALMAIAHVANAMAAEAPTLPAKSSPARAAYPVRRWVEVALVASIGILAVGLVAGGVVNARRAAGRAACANNLQALHKALGGYSDTHDGRFPRVGTPEAPTGGSFANVLVAAGQLPRDAMLGCSPRPNEIAPVGYAYTLGYLGRDGQVLGLRRDDGDAMPLVADRPAAGVAPWAAPVSPHVGGQNVLFAGGNVRFATVATVGPNNDDIYVNLRGEVKAGLNKYDISLGGSGDRP